MTHSLLRDRTQGEARVSFVELFFDLVFVFAVTQLAHLLIEQLTPAGAARTLVLVLAVWWVWIYTSWVTNWLDPERHQVRLMLFALMLAGLVLTASIPAAFEERGIWFASAYVAMQVGRSLFMLWALGPREERNFRNFIRITAWLGLSGVLWITGGLVDGDARAGLWAFAILIDLSSPALGFWVPGLGRSRSSDWDVDGTHLAERCGLFIIIALGESILVTGATFAKLAWTPAVLAAFAAGLVGSIAMWWIYFNIGAERATRVIERADDPGHHARLAYTYLHVVIVAGIIVGAVGDEIMLTHPLAATGRAEAAVLAGGPGLFIFGCLLFKWATAGWPPLSHLAGLLALAALFVGAPALPPVLVGWIATSVLAIVAVWETRSLSGEPEEVAPIDEVAREPGEERPLG